MAAVLAHTFCPPSRILTCRLPAVTPVAQRLAVTYVIPVATTTDGQDMVGMCLTLAITHTAALLARPSVTQQNSQTPRPVCLVAVPSSSSVGPSRIVTPRARRPQTHGTVCRDPLWHQLLSMTVYVALAFVVAATSFTYGRAYAASGSEYTRPSVEEGASVIDCTLPAES